MPVNLIKKESEFIRKNKILLCACKKYLKNQKNGILLISFEENNDNKIYYKFYDTKNFEVYCFCPILIINIDKYLNNKSIIKDTDFFFCWWI